MFGLVVQAAQYTSRGTAVIVLHKIQIKARLVKGLRIPVFHKKAAFVAKDARFEYQHVWQMCLDDLQFDFLGVVGEKVENL